MVEKYELAPGYQISRVINGCWQLSEGHSLNASLDLQDVMKAFNLLAEKGFTTFDCADIYTGAEEFLGQFIKQLKRSSNITPDDIQIHTKYVPDINLLAQIDFACTEKIIDRSLMRLNREILDLVQFHWWDYAVPGYIETAGFLQRLQEKGKIRHVAATNFDGRHLADILAAGIKIVSCQTQYSVFDRRPEKGFLDFCRNRNITQLCYGTLSGGLLAEKYIGQTSIQPNNRSQIKYMQVIEETLGWDGYQKLLLLLAGIACKHQVEIAHVATKYILGQPGIGASIIGTRNSRHVESNERIFTFQLDSEDIGQIRDFLGGYAILEGEPFELERTVGSKFRNIMKMNLNQS